MLGPLRGVAEHIQARKVLMRVPDEELQSAPLIQAPLPKMSRTPGAIKALGQPLGASTVPVLREPGFSDDEIARFREDGVVAGPD